MGSADNKNHPSQLSGPPLRRIDEQELQRTLEHHKQWADARDEGKLTEGAPADFSRTDLAGLNLSGSDLRHADLHGACLRGTDLRRANLHAGDLTGANLLDARLQEADLRDANPAMICSLKPLTATTSAWTLSLLIASIPRRPTLLSNMLLIVTACCGINWCAPSRAVNRAIFSVS